MSEVIFTAAGQTSSLQITGTENEVNSLDVPTINNAITNNLVKSGLTAVWAGGSASNAFTISGLPSTAVVVAQIKSQANAVGIKAVTVTANTLTVNFTDDPGTGTQLSYIYTNAAQ